MEKPRKWGCIEKTMLRCLFLAAGILCVCSVVTGAEEKKEAHGSCTVCHRNNNDFRAIKPNINETCLECHPKAKRNDHPIQVAPKTVPEGLPLDEGGKITCITCHEPHGKKGLKKLLRMEFSSLCVSCHKDK
jgi:predicted CXXCH cytochrome family protein